MVEAGFAERLRLPLAWLENRSGGFVKPNIESGQRGLASGSDAPPDNLAMVATDPEGAHSYPIVTYTWALLRRQHDDPMKTAAIRRFIRWSVTTGQQYAEPLWYVPLPKNVVQAVLAELEGEGA